MRFMTLVKAREDSAPMPREFMEVMAKAAGEATRNGKLLDTGGLAPTTRSTRVRLADGEVTVLDGPYAEGKEVVGGYGVIEASSHEEAVQDAVWLMSMHRDHWPGWEGEVEVRQIEGPQDIAPQTVSSPASTR